MKPTLYNSYHKKWINGILSYFKFMTMSSYYVSYIISKKIQIFTSKE
jgi:hypothetical protein